MRKISLIVSPIVVLILLIFVVTPLFMGFWLQKHYPEVVAKFNNTHEVSLQILSFKRGWFHSRAKLQVNISGTDRLLSGDKNLLAQFVVDQNIAHGPIVLMRKINGSRQVALALAAMENKCQEASLDFRANTLWTLNNRLKTKIAINHLSLGTEQERVEINQLQGDVNYVPRNAHLKTQFKLASGELFESNPEKVESNIIDLIKVLSVKDFQLDVDISKNTQFWIGSRHLTAKSVVFYPYARTNVAANNWNLEILQTAHDHLTDVIIHNQVDNIESNSTKISQFQMSLALKDMNGDALENFSHEALNNSPLQRFKLYSLLIALFNKGMTLELNQLQFTTPEGQVFAHAKFFSPTPAQGEEGWLYTLENMRAQAQFNLPKLLLKKQIIHFYQNKMNAHPEQKIDPTTLAQKNLDYWISQNILVANNDQVQMDIHFDSGKLLINGKKPALRQVVMGINEYR